MIEVRPIAKGEGALLLPFTHLIAATHWPGSVKASGADYEQALFAENPIIGAQLAFVDGVNAGAAVWHRSFSTNAGKEIMYLEDFSVLPQFQRRGVAKALMKSVAEVARARGYETIFWFAMPWNEGAVSFYNSLGAQSKTENILFWLDEKAIEALAQ